MVQLMLGYVKIVELSFVSDGFMLQVVECFTRKVLLYGDPLDSM